MKVLFIKLLKGLSESHVIKERSNTVYIRLSIRSDSFKELWGNETLNSPMKDPIKSLIQLILLQYVKNN